MKKLFLIALLFTISVNIFAQIDSVSTSITETERIIDKYTDKIGAAIIALSEKLQQPAEFVWTSLVKQNLLEGYLNLIPIVLMFVFIVLFFKYRKKSEWDSCNDAENFEAVMSIIMGILSIIFFIASVFCIRSGILKILNPEYYAIQDIFSLIN